MDAVFFLFALFLLPLSGYLLLRGFFGRLTALDPLERAVFSFAFGLGSLDFSMIALGRAGFPLSAPVMILSLFLLPGTVLLARLSFERIAPERIRKEKPTFPKPRPSERKLFLILFALTILVKTFFLASAGLPTATDLGHHMYWAKLSADTETLPEYAKTEIIGTDEEADLSGPEPIADFIIGEHLPFTAIAKLSGASFFGAFPVSFLFLVNILSILSLFLLAVRTAAALPLGKDLSPFTVGLATLFFAGPLFALSSPEAKFVSGGVVGNLFGNLLIPLVLLSFFRAISERDGRFLGAGILLSFTLAYTHHLSTLVLAFVMTGAIAATVVAFRKSLPEALGRVGKTLLSPHVLAAVLFAGLFMATVALPTYIETDAVGTAVGAPSKDTRTGLSLSQVSDSIGMSRLAIGAASLLLAILIPGIRHSWAFPFLAGWGAMLLVMTVRPDWVFLDIPSNRIGNYLAQPFSLLAGFLLASLPFVAKDLGGGHGRSPLPGRLFLLLALVVFAAPSWNGMRDNRTSIPGKDDKATETLQVFDASNYLAEHSLPDDLFLKDHNYLVADAWMKLFFMRDYSYPLSRGYFKRYEDETNPRERCTLLMISTPNLPGGRACYESLGVNLVAVHPAYDAAQFEKSRDFSRIYAGPDIQVYERKR